MAITRDLAIAQALRPGLTPINGGRRQGEAGTSRGLNIAPGSEDDGWVVPPPAELPDGTRVQLYKDGEALHAAYQAIRTAKSRVCLEVYIFASDATGQAFADLLCAKAREGVSVYLIYDSFGSIASDPSMFERMRHAGVNVQEFHPMRPWECRFSWRPANRNHRKMLLIDSEIAGLGGLNIGREYAGSWVGSTEEEGEFWRDNAIGIVGPSARLLLSSFARTWQYVIHGGRIRRAEYLHKVDGNHFGVLASVPSMASPLGGMLRKLVREARESVELTMAYFAPPDDFIDELCRAARRGVRVRLMLPNRSDVPLLVPAARSFYEMLMSAGVEIYERLGVVLHAKTMVIDQEISVVGSANLDYASIEFNLEVSAVIRSATMGKQMHDLFDHDVRFAQRIDLATWRRRPMLDRIAQWAVKRSRYLL